LDERNWPIYIAKKVQFILKLKLLQKVLVNYAYSACLFIAVSNHVTLLWRVVYSNANQIPVRMNE